MFFNIFGEKKRKLTKDSLPLPLIALPSTSSHFILMLSPPALHPLPLPLLSQLLGRKWRISVVKEKTEWSYDLFRPKRDWGYYTTLHPLSLFFSTRRDKGGLKVGDKKKEEKKWWKILRKVKKEWGVSAIKDSVFWTSFIYRLLDLELKDGGNSRVLKSS